MILLHIDVGLRWLDWLSPTSSGGGASVPNITTTTDDDRHRRTALTCGQNESVQHVVPDGQRHDGRMGPQVLFHVLLGVRRRAGRVGRGGDRVHGDIRRVRRGQRVHRLGRAQVPGNAYRHQLLPTQPHRGRPAVRHHHAGAGLRPCPARLAVRRFRLPTVALLAGACLLCYNTN